MEGARVAKQRKEVKKEGRVVNSWMTRVKEMVVRCQDDGVKEVADGMG